MPDLDLTTDHKLLDDDLAARRYFAKFDGITRLLSGVAAEMEKDRAGFRDVRKFVVGEAGTVLVYG